MLFARCVRSAAEDHRTWFVFNVTVSRFGKGRRAYESAGGCDPGFECPPNHARHRSYNQPGAIICKTWAHSTSAGTNSNQRAPDERNTTVGVPALDLNKTLLRGALALGTPLAGTQTSTCEEAYRPQVHFSPRERWTKRSARAFGLNY